MRLNPAGVVLLLALGGIAAAQQSQPVPDAPSATRTKEQNPFPVGTAPAPKDGREPPQSPVDVAPREQQGPMPQTRTEDRQPPLVPGQDSRDELFTFRENVNFVIVPVTVRDQDGRLVSGLLRRDFRVLEDGAEQKIHFFTSDPFPLAVAVVLDQGLPDVDMQRVNESLPTLVGAFSEFDEVALYSYGNTITRELDFGSASARLSTAVQKARRRGRTGVPVTSGPMGPNTGPIINGRPLDPGQPRVITAQRESRVLNDAILRAALDLSRRDRARRRVIFVISDGTETGSTAEFAEVRKVLLSNEISVYALGVSSAAIPGYGRAQRTRLPGTGIHGNILPSYVVATGGEMFSEFSRDAIERAYARITETARNQYTLGYTTRVTPSSAYRSIEVLVRRPSVTVHARDGYFPLPPADRRGAPGTPR